MSVDFVALGFKFFVTNPNAVVLSVCTGVGGCGCPICSSRALIGIASWVLMRSAPISAAAADGAGKEKEQILPFQVEMSPPVLLSNSSISILS